MEIFEKKRIFKLLSIVFFTFCFLIIIPSLFAATGECQPGGCMKNVRPECACYGDCELNDILRIAVAWAKSFVRGAAIFALIFFIVGGIMWLTSSGNPEQVKRGKQILVQTIIALLIVFFAWQIVNLVICGLSKGTLKEPCTIFPTKLKWYVFPGEVEKKKCQAEEKQNAECLTTYQLCPDLNTSGNLWQANCQDETKVKSLQRKLAQLCCDLGSPGIDGCYGPETTSAVISFCQKNDCRIDGKVDLETYNKITTGANLKSCQ